MQRINSCTGYVDRVRDLQTLALFTLLHNVSFIVPWRVPFISVFQKGQVFEVSIAIHVIVVYKHRDTSVELEERYINYCKVYKSAMNL